MNLALPFIGGSAVAVTLSLDNEITATDFVVTYIDETTVVETTPNIISMQNFAIGAVTLSLDNEIIATDLVVTYIDETTVVEATPNIIAIQNFAIGADIISIDNEFSIPIIMEKGLGFPVYIGELATHSDTVASLDMDAVLTTEATAYIAGDVHTASDIQVHMSTENTIDVNGNTINVSNDISASDMQISIEGTVESTDGTSVLLSADRVYKGDLSLLFTATITAIDVLIECVNVPEDQIVYKVADIDKSMLDGTVTIHPDKWSAVVINAPVLKDGSRTSISNFFIKKLKAKYGEDIHNYISMIISRDSVTGDEFNYIVSEGYITPDESMNDFRLCSLEDDVFKPIPFLVKSVSSETLTIDWEA